MTAALGAAARVPVELAPGWGFRDKLHGGYLLARTVGAALGLAPAEHPHPLAVQAVYPAPPRPGEAVVTVRPLRSGRTVSTFHASLGQDGRAAVEALVTAGRLPEADAPARWQADAEAPTLPDPEDCLGGSRNPRGQRRPDGLGEHLRVRLDPAWAPPPYGPGGRADLRGWVGCDYPAEPGDPVLGALILADALPPVTLDIGMPGWMPTLQLQVLLRRVPPPGWLAARQWGTLLAGGLLDEQCTLWAAGGQVVAQARQLVAVRES